MNKLVKITTFEKILDMVFPCYCKGCGKIGTPFCGRCYFYNRKENPGFFTSVDKEFQMIFACGFREKILSEMILEYKYHSRQYFSKVFAQYLYDTIFEFFPEMLTEKVVIVPLPTIQKHIRSRGFDHILRIARDFAEISGFLMSAILLRNKSGVQVGSTEEMRLKQAEEAYMVDSRVDFREESHFLLLDDVWTTGASLRAARKVLEEELLRRGIPRNKIKISAIILAKNSGQEF